MQMTVLVYVLYGKSLPNPSFIDSIVTKLLFICYDNSCNSCFPHTVGLLGN
jgi:hypothetical protein